MRKNAWLYATIVINLLLISLLGQKLIIVAGYATNIGNVYYAAVFFAIYLLLENATRVHVIRAISIGTVSVVAFTALLLLGLGMQSHPATEGVSAMMSAVYGNAPRFALASIVAFVVAQGVNVALYLTAREEPTHIHWWIRLLVVILLAQLIDSLIFFSIAFWGVISSGLVIEGMVTGYLVKVGVGVATIPLIHWSRRMRRVGDS